MNYTFNNFETYDSNNNKSCETNIPSKDEKIILGKKCKLVINNKEITNDGEEICKSCKKILNSVRISNDGGKSTICGNCNSYVLLYN